MSQHRRVGKFCIDDVLNNVVFTSDGSKQKGQRNLNVYHWYDGKRVNMSSQRYQLFATKGLSCVCCGITGSFFSLDESSHIQKGAEEPILGYHFNLIALDDDGNEVLMTKDHILPKSKGGKDYLSNYQTMCVLCNLKKANNID